MKLCVLGGGITGLTTALKLAEDGYAVSVVARDIGLQSPSKVATAIWHVYYVKADDANVLQWSNSTLQKLVEISKIDPSAGVELVDGVELFRNSEPNEPVWAHIPPKFAMLTTSQLAKYQKIDNNIKWGYNISAPCADMKIYLPWLQKSFEDKGGRTFIRDISALSEVANQFDLIINCTGFGARELMNDGELRAVKGQYLVYASDRSFPNFYIGDDHHPDGTAYVIPRNNQIIIGGTEEEGVEDLDFTVGIDPLFERSVAFSPWLNDIARDSFVEKVTGIRPYRPIGIRFGLDRETCEIPVIHNYGHGGSGFSLSWGCAASVADLVQDVSKWERK